MQSGKFLKEIIPSEIKVKVLDNWYFLFNLMSEFKYMFTDTSSLGGSLPWLFPTFLTTGLLFMFFISTHSVSIWSKISEFAWKCWLPQQVELSLLISFWVLVSTGLLVCRVWHVCMFVTSQFPGTPSHEKGSKWIFQFYIPFSFHTGILTLKLIRKHILKIYPLKYSII